MVFQKIDQKGKILSFSQDKNYIDFLTVKKFSGSQVGPIMLMFPEKWEGPYIKDNPAIQEKLYQVIKTYKGYFIVPGDGVKLASLKVIGKDIVFDSNSDIESMIVAGGVLNSENRPLAAKIKISEGSLTEYIQLLAGIFGQIDKHCTILSFDHKNNPINFLNVKNFVGSEIGAMDLKYPDKWKGPYATYNPTYQGKLYEVIKAQDGYYIVPGLGVVLPDGRAFGRDIIIDEASNVAQLISSGMLILDGKPLAVKIELGGYSKQEKPMNPKLQGLLFGEEKIGE